jgi:NADH:ubiquinone oxidoreductase subunit 5 (subunit L)/multisubunit Na+/H+ antiporter MnhA subunit
MNILLNNYLLLNIYTFLNNKWNFDQIYNAYIARPLLNFGHNISYKLLDRGWFELLGPTGIASLLKNITSHLSSLQSGALYNYAFTMFVSAILYISIFSNYLIDSSILLNPYLDLILTIIIIRFATLII